jgi:hypothetical protein
VRLFDLSQSPSRSELALFEKPEQSTTASFRNLIRSASSGARHPQAISASGQTSIAARGPIMIEIIAVLCNLSSPANCHVEQQDQRRTREGLQPVSARGHCLTDRRRLTRLWKRLPAQARPVITRANNSKLPTTATALDQPEPNQPSKCISNGQDSPSCLWHSKQHQEEARFRCPARCHVQSLTRLTVISH